VRLERGADFGWAECDFDGPQQKLVLAPEYGGEGGKAVGPCVEKRALIASFSAHWAPNDLAFYDGHQFPIAYRGRVFIAFHGSWNGAPYRQGATTWCSSRSQTERPAGTSSYSPTVSRGR
jgi:glucose/arabinose dehydrogenase